MFHRRGSTEGRLRRQLVLRLHRRRWWKRSASTVSISPGDIHMRSFLELLAQEVRRGKIREVPRPVHSSSRYLLKISLDLLVMSGLKLF